MVAYLDNLSTLRTPPDQPLVLVVDDEPSLRDAIAYSLKREGWRVELASDGLEALQLSGVLQPDLIVLDVMLPGLDGIQVCRAIRARSDVPVLFLSAKGEDVDRILGLEIGGDDYIDQAVRHARTGRARAGEFAANPAWASCSPRPGCRATPTGRDPASGPARNRPYRSHRARERSDCCAQAEGVRPVCSISWSIPM